MFQRKLPYEKEWEKLNKKEIKFAERRFQSKDSFLNQKLEGKVPQKLQSTLDAAFVKAFALVFEKGTGIIEKTYKKEEIEKGFQINQYANEVKPTRKSLKKFSNNAGNAGRVNTLLSGVSGVGMGALGIGIPDIPVFTGILLKSIYEIALHYGYEYESESEQCFILLLIQGGIVCGEDFRRIDAQVNDYIELGTFLQKKKREEQIEQTAKALSKELLYMKFLQGIPLVGVVGGAADAVYMKQITEYAGLKYQRRFLAAERHRHVSQ